MNKIELFIRKLLLKNYIYYLFLSIVIIISIITITTKKQSIYNENTKTVTGKVVEKYLKNNNLKLVITNKEKIQINYYLKANEKLIINLGDIVRVEGLFEKPKSKTTKYLFDYKKYLERKKIFYQVKASTITIEKENQNLFYKIKNKLLSSTKKSAYLEAFILGIKENISPNVLKSYQENGISHLFAISGMHITLLSSLIMLILKKLKISEFSQYIFTSIFLLLYLLFLNTTSSSIRGVLFFIFFKANNLFYCYVKPLNIYLVVFSITLLINPFYIFDPGFIYSFLISLTLILMSDKIKGSYLKKIFLTSLISFLISLPISLYFYNQVNILSIFYNLFFVPYVSLIIFPISLLTLLFPFLMPLYNFLTSILEAVSLFLNKITFSKLIFKRTNIVIYIIYFIIIIFIFKSKKNKKHYLILSIILLIHYMFQDIFFSTNIYMIDVGQGDSILIKSKTCNVLIDTGGSKYKDDYIIKNTTIPLMKSLGIKKLSKLILTHGDVDHMKEASYLLDNFKVDEVVLNSGKNNYLEKSILTKAKNIINAYEGYSFTCGSLDFVQLNSSYSDENSSSQVYFVTNQNITILLTGDAPIRTEHEILKKYNIPQIDILKVGHHGSNTSTSKELVNLIKPKECLISVGKDNKYGHPKKDVLNILNDYCNIYRTDINGSIQITLNEDSYKVKQYSK